MRYLPIVGQPFVSSDARNCDGSAATRQELERAVAVLGHALRPLGIEPRLEIVAFDEASFEANAVELNRIWIAGKPMEQWLDETVGSSHRDTICEASPERLILKAALIASSELIDHVTVSVLTAALVGRTQHAMTPSVCSTRRCLIARRYPVVGCSASTLKARTQSLLPARRRLPRSCDATRSCTLSWVGSSTRI